jgi:hypothetical protein
MSNQTHASRKTPAFTVALALILALLFGVLAMFGSRTASAADPITDPGAPSGDGVKPTLIQGNPETVVPWETIANSSSSQ